MPPLLHSTLKAYLVAKEVQEGPNKSYLVSLPTTKEAATFEQDLEFFLGPLAETEVSFFPPHDALPFSSLSPHPDILCERMKTLWRLKQKPPPSIVVTTAAALLEPLPPPDTLTSVFLKVGEEFGQPALSRQEFLKLLPAWGYQSASLVTEFGNYAVRGALVDLYSPLYAHPLRIEWMGDLVESLRFFDPKTQRTTQKIVEAEVIPTREVLLTPVHQETFATEFRRKGEERDIPKGVWGPLIEKVRNGIPFPGIETYLPCFYSSTTSLLDWLPENFLVRKEWEPKILEEYLREIRSLEHKNSILTTQEVRFPFERVTDRLRSSGWQEKELLPFETHDDLRPALEKARQSAHPLAPLTDRLKKWVETDQVYLVTSTLGQTERLRDLLHSLEGVITTEDHFVETSPSGKIRIVTGNLSSGFRIAGGVNLITEEEIFGTKARPLDKKKRSVFDLTSLAGLKLRDPVVHNQHGISLYQGLVHLTIDGIANDFVLLEFRNGDKLYLPVYRMNLITRYSGSEGVPRLDKLGGTTWETVKKKAQKAIREMAGELLNLYAARKSGKGFAFSPPNEIFEAFEASFPFEETPDQEEAIRDVLKDMESPQPMDRLVLGDVGYGKTEVAMRAAFKGVLDGKQVALLVPTTLLAFQHFERFGERFKDYPVTVEMLSRFRSPPEQKEIVRKGAEGKIDILIGTHRLLQPDVSFKNLGLLVIDEEHRFGVSHKEKIKRLKKNVDVLTLSATPIPRTLHLSLVGLRAISVIETPPTDRLSIRTFVLRFEADVIREAIRREIKRGGQVFFVHNQIETIEEMKRRLVELVPEIKIEIGHGQMEEEDLENVMIRFSHHEFDLLLCTTIIESGIDIPTANTILIHRAERLGLAQIYQLRGRVGRGGHRAYAYLIISDEQKLTLEGVERLKVLQRFTELGSGFKLASYDLEIRGAGSLLGEKQSGHVAALGFELYTEILEETIRKMKGEKVLATIDPEFHFRIPAYIPEGYVGDPSVRLELYRRLSSMEEEEEVDPIAQEIADRFGPPPPEVVHLLEISALKTHAKKLRIKQIRHDGKSFVYAFDPSSPLSPEILLHHIRKEPKKYRLTPDGRLLVGESSKEGGDALRIAKKLLRQLSLHVTP